MDPHADEDLDAPSDASSHAPSDVDTLIRDRLRAEPDPGPMPEAVERRVGEALARAAEIRVGDRELFDELGLVEEDVDPAEGSLVGLPGGAAASPSAEARARNRRWPLLAAAAAVVALLAIGGITLVGSLRSGPDGLAALPGTTSAAPTSVATSVSGRLHIQASGTAYTAETLASGARAIVTNPGPEVTADQASALGPLATTDGANACVAALGDADAPSVTLDLATYAGRPAAIIVIARDGKTTAYAVQRGCATGDPEVIKDSVPVP